LPYVFVFVFLRGEKEYQKAMWEKIVTIEQQEYYE